MHVELNALIRGQSNALLMVESNHWAGYGTIVSRVQQLLGFDGVKDTVNLEYAAGTATGHNTVNSGTAFLTEWLNAKNGDWHKGWTAAGYEQGLLGYINDLTAAQKAEPTAVVWLHSEYDSRNGALTPDQWTSAVRYDAGLVRQAFGKAAADLPYLFVSAIPYWGTEQGHQSIRIGMEQLAADAGFNAGIAARAIDIDMSHDDLDGNWQTVEYGGPHMSDADALMVAERVARSLAQEWAAYAKPGSPVALAGGNIDDLGPQVISATHVGQTQLELKVRFDAATKLAALDPDAAKGVGWQVDAPDGTHYATAAKVTGADTLLVTFDGPVAGDGTLYYGYGYGRLEGAGGEGEGNAVYDNNGLPIWVPATGLAIGGGSSGGGGTPDHAPVSLSAGSGPDTLVLEVSQDWYQGDSTYTVSVDGVQVGGLFTASALHSSGQHDTVTLKGSWGAGSHMVTVEHTNDLWVPGVGDRNLYVTGATYDGVHSDALGGLWTGGSFTVTASAAGGLPAPGPGGQLIQGTAGKDWLVGGAGADVIQGMAGNDRMAGRGGADVFVLSEGDGHDRIAGFTPGVDKLFFAGGLGAADVSTEQATHGGRTGLDVHYGSAGDVVFLLNVTSLAAGDIVFA